MFLRVRCGLDATTGAPYQNIEDSEVEVGELQDGNYHDFGQMLLSFGTWAVWGWGHGWEPVVRVLTSSNMGPDAG